MAQHKRAIIIILTSILTVALILFLLSSFQPLPAPDKSITINPNNENWPMFRYDLTHTGNTLSNAPTSPDLYWTFTTQNAYPNGPPEAIKSSPTIANGLLYFAGEINLYCLNASDGSQKWIYPTMGIAAATPTVAGRYVYAAVAALADPLEVPSSPNIVCLDALTGAQIWNFTPSAPITQSSPTVVDGYLYIQSYDGNIYCLDAASGYKIWSYQTYGSGMSTPAIVDGLLYIGSGDANINCLNASTGAKLWNFTTGVERPSQARAVVSSPTITDGLLYIGSLDRNIYCLNASNGEKIWNYTTGNWIESSPAIAAGRVYIGSNDHSLYCLNAYSGEKIWNFSTTVKDVPYFGIQCSPAIAQDQIYFGSSNYIYCLNTSTGEKLWEYATDGNIGWNSPAIANNIVYFTTAGGTTYAFK